MHGIHHPLVDLDMERNTLLADNRTALEAHFPNCTLLYGRYPQQPRFAYQAPMGGLEYANSVGFLPIFVGNMLSEATFLEQGQHPVVFTSLNLT
jgi:hypothetical protein